MNQEQRRQRIDRFLKRRQVAQIKLYEGIPSIMQFCDICHDRVVINNKAMVRGLIYDICQECTDTIKAFGYERKE